MLDQNAIEQAARKADCDLLGHTTRTLAKPKITRLATGEFKISCNDVDLDSYPIITVEADVLTNQTEAHRSLYAVIPNTMVAAKMVIGQVTINDSLAIIKITGKIPFQPTELIF